MGSLTMSAILIIEDDYALGTALALAVRRTGHLPTLLASGTAGLEAMKRETFAALVLDIGLPDMSGLRVLETVRAKSPALPVLVVTAHATLDHAISAQKLGATEYLAKPLDLKQFDQTLRALVAKTLPVDAPLPAAPANMARAVTLIGAAACLQEVFVGIAKAAAGDVPALVTGPSGSGKSLAAAVIHAHSTRAGKKLHSVECLQLKDAAALATQLTATNEGTLVLKEITQMPAEAQAHLAAWLAAPPTPRPRLLASTSADPREAVRNGTLRAEIFYAFSTLTIPVPALHERTGDLPVLSAYFLELRGAASRIQLTPPALAALQAYAWPGNVRELRHVLDYAATMSRGGAIFLSHLPAHVAASAQDASTLSSTGELDVALGRWLDQQLTMPSETTTTYDTLQDRIEAVMLRHLLSRFENKPTHLATALSMNRATLRQKLRRTGLQRDEE